MAWQREKRVEKDEVGKWECKDHEAVSLKLGYRQNAARRIPDTSVCVCVPHPFRRQQRKGTEDIFQW